MSPFVPAHHQAHTGSGGLDAFFGSQQGTSKKKKKKKKPRTGPDPNAPNAPNAKNAKKAKVPKDPNAPKRKYTRKKKDGGSSAGGAADPMVVLEPAKPPEPPSGPPPEKPGKKWSASGYMLYSDRVREQVRAENPGLLHKYVMGKIAEKWKLLSEVESTPFHDEVASP